MRFMLIAMWTRTSQSVWLRDAVYYISKYFPGSLVVPPRRLQNDPVADAVLRFTLQHVPAVMSRFARRSHVESKREKQLLLLFNRWQRHQRRAHRTEHACNNENQCNCGAC